MVVDQATGACKYFPLAPLHSKKGRDAGDVEWVDDDAVTPDSLPDDYSDEEVE
jgi:hypothetical protein